MHDTGFDLPLQDWFDFKIPSTCVKRNFIATCVEAAPTSSGKQSSRLVWIGNTPLVSEFRESNQLFLKFTFHTKAECFDIDMEEDVGEWFLSILGDLSPTHVRSVSIADMRASYELECTDFEGFWHSEAVSVLRENGLLVL
jgi:hypothetical protein